MSMNVGCKEELRKNKEIPNDIILFQIIDSTISHGGAITRTVVSYRVKLLKNLKVKSFFLLMINFEILLI